MESYELINSYPEYKIYIEKISLIWHSPILIAVVALSNIAIALLAYDDSFYSTNIISMLNMISLLIIFVFAIASIFTIDIENPLLLLGIPLVSIINFFFLLKKLAFN